MATMKKISAKVAKKSVKKQSNVKVAVKEKKSVMTPSSDVKQVATKKKVVAKPILEKKSMVTKKSAIRASVTKNETGKARRKVQEAPANNPEMRRLNGKLLKPGKKKIKEKTQAPLRMKKMVTKLPKAPLAVCEFVNNQKEFAFAFAESMKAAAAQTTTVAVTTPVIRLSRRPTTRKQGTETLRFSDADLVVFRKSLLTLRDSVEGKTRMMKQNALEQTIDRAGEDEDGSDSFMRLQNLGQANEQNKVLQKIDDALRRIADGTYGICEMCGKLIRKQRLQHLPFAHTCMECQSAMEGK